MKASIFWCMSNTMVSSLFEKYEIPYQDKHEECALARPCVEFSTRKENACGHFPSTLFYEEQLGPPIASVGMGLDQNQSNMDVEERNNKSKIEDTTRHKEKPKNTTKNNRIKISKEERNKKMRLAYRKKGDNMEHNKTRREKEAKNLAVSTSVAIAKTNIWANRTKRFKNTEQELEEQCVAKGVKYICVP